MKQTVGLTINIEQLGITQLENLGVFEIRNQKYEIRRCCNTFKYEVEH